MVNIAVVGCGRWGVNYVRILEEIANARVDWVYDRDELSLKKVVHRFPTVKAARTLGEVINSPDVDAVVVATPASEHHDAVKKALLAGKHVLVEKPIALTIDESLEMIELAASQKKVLMVGHTFIFNSGVKALKGYIREDAFGKMYYLHATRTNMGPIRNDVNAIWDLAPHDVSIFNYLLESAPRWVSATGVRLFDNEREDVGFLTLGYPENVLANIHVSWADPYKVREVVAVGSKRRIVFDDLESLERVKVYEKGVTKDKEAESYGEFRLLMRDGDIISPKVENTEPLKEQCIHFLECINENKKPLSDGATGLDVIRVMLAADESLKSNGAPVEVTAGVGA